MFGFSKDSRTACSDTTTLNGNLSDQTDVQLRVSYSETWLDELNTDEPVQVIRRDEIFKINQRDQLVSLSLKQVVFNDKTALWGGKKSFLVLDTASIDDDKRDKLSVFSPYSYASLQLRLSEK